MSAGGCSRAETSYGAASNDGYLVAGAVTVELATSLPACVRGKRGAVYYVQSEGQLYYCDGRQYRQLKLPAATASQGLCVVEPASLQTCVHGGVEIATGRDRDRDGELDHDEIELIESVCNGADGSSCNVSTDADGVKTITCTDGTTAVITDGMDGMDAEGWIVAVETASKDACPSGGTTISTGPDEDGDGAIDVVATTQHVCNDALGAPSPTVGVRTRREDALDQCPAGGVLVEAGVDDNGDGELADSEVDSSAPLCDGEDALIDRVTSISKGAECEFGGERREHGIDDDDDGELDDSEVLPDLTTVVCLEPRAEVAGASLEADDIIRGADLVADEPRFVHYVLDFGADRADPSRLIAPAQRALTTPLTADGLRTAFAIDVLAACCGAQLIKLEPEIEYVMATEPATDLLLDLQARTAAVVLVPSMIPFPVTSAYAAELWLEQLETAQLALANLAAVDLADKAVLVVFIQGPEAAALLETGWHALDDDPDYDTLVGDTLVVLIETRASESADIELYQTLP